MKKAIEGKELKRAEIYVYGAGAGGRRAIKALANSYRIRAVIDGDLSKAGTELMGYPVVGASEIEVSAERAVVIASEAVLEIATLLLSLGVKEENILVLEESIRVGAADGVYGKLFERLDCCHRFEEPGFLGQLNPFYINKRDSFFERIFSDFEAAHGSLLSAAVAEAQGARLDERLIEIFYAADIVRGKVEELEIKPDILDVGCVLNQYYISRWLEQNTNSIMFNNPSVETVNGFRSASYLIGDPRKMSVTPSLEFDVVFSLSTLEHVGMNNLRYGGSREEFDGECLNPESFAIEALTPISRLVKKGGTLVVSVPFGEFRYFYLPATGLSPVYYSFNEEKIEALCKSLTDFRVEVDVWRFDDSEGWVSSSLSAKDWPEYGCDNPGAGAVALIRATRLDKSNG